MRPFRRSTASSLSLGIIHKNERSYFMEIWKGVKQNEPSRDIHSVVAAIGVSGTAGQVSDEAITKMGNLVRLLR